MPEKTQTTATNSQQEPAGGTIEPVSNKMEAMRRALRELGKNAKPADLQEHLKSRFGLDMKKDLISKYKSDILTKKHKKKKGAKTAAAEPAATSKPGPKPGQAAAKKASNGKGILLADLMEIKGLVHRVGVDQLRALIAAFAR
jgi:hypothetical protein